MAGLDTIVIVEDSLVRNFLRAALQRHGYLSVCASSDEAANILRSGRATLLITNSPAQFSEFGAVVPLLYLAAFPEPSAAASFDHWVALPKPFQNAALVHAVRQLLVAR
jgi:hypothetical protein